MTFFYVSQTPPLIASSFSAAGVWLFLPLLLLYICLSWVSIAVINTMSKKTGFISLTVHSPS